MSENYLDRFEVMFDIDEGRENPNSYAVRIKNSVLPNWPLEVLIEWLYRHNCQIDRYSFIGFERFVFQKESWRLEDLPGRHCFDDPTYFDSIIADLNHLNVPTDWVAKYIAKNGTWNTPIILLDNTQKSDGAKPVESLKSPFHLLEGHHRLAYLIGLREKVPLKELHDIWIVRI